MTSRRESCPRPSRRRTAASCGGVVDGGAGDRGLAARRRDSAISGSPGCQTRRKATIAPTDSSEATMSVSSTER